MTQPVHPTDALYYTRNPELLAAAQLLARLACLGARMVLNDAGDGLSYRGPKGSLTAELADAIRTHRTELMVLAAFEPASADPATQPPGARARAYAVLDRWLAGLDARAGYSRARPSGSLSREPSQVDRLPSGALVWRFADGSVLEVDESAGAPLATPVAPQARAA